MRQELGAIHVGPVHGRERGGSPHAAVDAPARERTHERQRAVNPSPPDHVPPNELLRMMRIEPGLPFSVPDLLAPIGPDRRTMVVPDERRWRESDLVLLR